MENAASIYTDGTYLEMTMGSWGVANSSLKANWILDMLGRHPGLDVRTICEIGCGGGGILHELEARLPNSSFTGYEISPQAYALSVRFETEKCHFVLGEAFGDERRFDLALIMDVAEHVEDCFAFLRLAREKARYQIYHLPIEAHVSAILRGTNAWDSVGHIHLFTVETAIKTLKHSGHRIIDSFLTDGILRSPYRTLKSRVANCARLPLDAVSKKWAARLLGGYSLIALTERSS